MSRHADEIPFLSRRRLLQSTAGAALGAALLPRSPAFAQEQETEKIRPAGRAARVVENGRIKQSLVHWCFSKYWEPAEMIEVARALGCQSIELISPQHFPLLKEQGLVCAIASVNMSPGPPFARGFNNPRHHDEVIKATKDAIDACAEHGFKRVISFTGMADGMSKEEGADNCVAGFKKVVGHAEKNGVTLCLEMLNTRDDSHPMKGHPGYQGDHTDYCVEIIERVGSENLKLLFDIYHVQIMDGDVIRRIRQHKDHLGHIHTAGNPGRGELDDTQEINYPPIMQALLEVGYDGYVGQEFIPTRNPLEGLGQAVKLCDV